MLLEAILNCIPFVGVVSSENLTLTRVTILF